MSMSILPTSVCSGLNPSVTICKNTFTCSFCLLSSQCMNGDTFNAELAMLAAVIAERDSACMPCTALRAC
jgi:hypothetical protein